MGKRYTTTNISNYEAESNTLQTFVQRLPIVAQEAWGIVTSVFLYIIIGISIGGAIHGFVPTGFFEEYIGKENPFAVPLAVLLGAPMYANPAGVVPLWDH